MSDKLLPDYILADSATILAARLREIGQLILQTNAILEGGLQAEGESRVKGEVDVSIERDFTKYYKEAKTYALEFEIENQFKEVINATFYPQYRRWMIFNAGNEVVEFCYTRFNDFDIFSFFLIPQKIYVVEDSGGIGSRLIAKGNLGDRIHVTRQLASDDPPRFDEDEMPIPVEVKLLFPAPAGVSQLPEGSPVAAQTNFTNWFGRNPQHTVGSDEGYKAFDIVTFQPGKPVQFLVSVSPSVTLGTNPNAPGQDINIYLPHPSVALKELLRVASDLVNPETDVLIPQVEPLVGNIITNGWQANLPKSGGVVALKPNFSQHIGLFSAINPSKGTWDTAIVQYLPAIDPYTGGTFVIVGF